MKAVPPAWSKTSEAEPARSTALFWRARALPRTSPPPETVEVPAKVLAAPSVRVPAPSFRSEPPALFRAVAQVTACELVSIA